MRLIICRWMVMGLLEKELERLRDTYKVGTEFKYLGKDMVLVGISFLYEWYHGVADFCDNNGCFKEKEFPIPLLEAILKTENR